MASLLEPFWNQVGFDSTIAGAAANNAYLETLFPGQVQGAGNVRIDSAGNITANGVTGPGIVMDSLVSPKAYGAVGDGVTDDTAALQKALAALTPGQSLWLSRKYAISSPLNVKPYTGISGPSVATQVSQTYSGGALVILASFAGQVISDSGSVTLSGAIVLLGQTFGGYSTVSEEQKIRNITIDGTNAPAGVQGILSYGRLQRVHLSEVLISKVTGDAVQHNLDASGNQPDAWYGYKVFARFCGGKGFSLRSADSTWILCLGSNNGDASCDWFINTTSNSKYIGCRSEHSIAGLGFGYVCTNAGNSSGGVLFSGCSTDQSFAHGFQVGGTINGIASGAHAVALAFTGCVFRRDGANGGSGGGGYAGFYDAAYNGQIVHTGLIIWPGVNDDGSGTNSPQIGLLADSGSILSVGAAYIQGATTAVTDSTTAGINWDNSVVTATGTTAAPTITKAPNIAAYQGKSLSLVPGAAPATDPLLITSANSGERAFGMKVSGDSSDRVKWTSDGKLNLGPGNATQDTIIQRNGVAAVKITGSLTTTGTITGPQTAPATTKPANPNGTVSTTDVMAGLAVAYTPASSGKCLVIVTGEGNTATAVTNFNVGGRFGTSTAPNNGDAVTGTRFGSAANLQPRPSGISNQTSFALNEVLSLTAGTAYWFDLSFSTNNASDQANLRNISISIIELS